MSQINKISIIIPVFNEAATVNNLLETVYNQELPHSFSKEMIIVESNSKDNTREIVKKFVEKKRNQKGSNTEVHLILQDAAKGKGSAAREGLAMASGDICLIQDGDLEYDIADYPILIEPIVQGHADFVLGSRHLSAGSWKIRKFNQSPIKSTVYNFGGAFFHWFFNFVYRVKLTDPTTMFKVFRTTCIQNVKFESNRFDFDFELVAKLVRLGFIPLEVPVSYRSRSHTEGKKVSLLRDPWTYLYAIIKFRITRIQRIPRLVAQKQNQEIISRKFVATDQNSYNA